MLLFTTAVAYVYYMYSSSSCCLANYARRKYAPRAPNPRGTRRVHTYPKAICLTAAKNQRLFVSGDMAIHQTERVRVCSDSIADMRSDVIFARGTLAKTARAGSHMCYLTYSE